MKNRIRVVSCPCGTERRLFSSLHRETWRQAGLFARNCRLGHLGGYQLVIAACVPETDALERMMTVRQSDDNSLRIWMIVLVLAILVEMTGRACSAFLSWRNASCVASWPCVYLGGPSIASLAPWADRSLALSCSGEKVQSSSQCVRPLEWHGYHRNI